MKSNVFWWLLLMSVNFVSAHNCIESAIVFTTQQQVDDFPSNYLGCTIVDGSVGVAGSVQNLDSLVQ